MGSKPTKVRPLYHHAEQLVTENRLEAAGVPWTQAGDAVRRMAILLRYQWALAAGMELGFKPAEVTGQFILHLHARHGIDVKSADLTDWEYRYRCGGIAALVDGWPVTLKFTPRRQPDDRLFDPARVAELVKAVPGLTLAGASKAMRREAICRRCRVAMIGADWLGFTKGQVTARFLTVVADRFGMVLSARTLANWNRDRSRGGLTDKRSSALRGKGRKIERRS